MCFKYKRHGMHHLLGSPESYSTLLVTWRLITLAKQSRKTREVLLRTSVNFRPPTVDVYTRKEVLMPNTAFFERYKKVHALKNTILNNEMRCPQARTTQSTENAFKVIYICTQVILFS